MMNDRFSAQLRQHLVDNANERPGDDQIADIVELVSATSQRHPLAARLTQFPEGAGRFEAPALRYALLVVAIALAMVAAAIFASGQGGRSSVFEGRWTAIALADGSVQFLIVGPGKRPTVRYEARVATRGPCTAGFEVFVADGVGTVNGNLLDVAFSDVGGCGTETFRLVPRDYTYDETTDTVTDGIRTWERASADLRLPSGSPPSTEPTPTPPPSPQPTPDQEGRTSNCVDLTEGGTYSAATGSFALTAIIPAPPTIPWLGERSFFQLGGVCGDGPTISVFAATIREEPANACVQGPLVQVTTFAEAVAFLAAQEGLGISERVDLSIDGRAAARFDVTGLAACPNGFGLQGGVILGANESGSIFVIDADGAVVSLEANWTVGATQTQIDEVRAIVASLQIRRLDGATSAPAVPSSVAP